jgi:hypothetical protein
LLSKRTGKQHVRSSINDNLEVKKVVMNLLDQVKKSEQTDVVKKDLTDAQYWINLGDEIMNKQKARMDKGEYNEDVFLQLGYAWRYYVEAGTKLTLAFKQFEGQGEEVNLFRRGFNF